MSTCLRNSSTKELFDPNGTLERKAGQDSSVEDVTQTQKSARVQIGREGVKNSVDGWSVRTSNWSLIDDHL